MAPVFPMYLGGYWKENSKEHIVTNPYDDSEVGKTFLAQPKDLDLAVTSALEAAPKLKETPTWQRAKWLHDLAELLEAERELIIRTMAQEAGKPLNDATTEFNR